MSIPERPLPESQWDQALSTLQSHRSVRRFTGEPVTESQLTHIFATAQRASTSSNLQSYSAVVVRNQDTKTKIAELCGNQRQIVDCDVFIAHCADLNRAKQVCEQAGYDFDAGFMEYFLIGVIDATIFAQNALAAAEAVGLGGCMIGGARNHPYELAEELKLPPLVFVTFGMTLGVPLWEKVPPHRARLPLEGIVHRETYDPTVIDRAHTKYDRTSIDTGMYGKRRIDLTDRIDGWTDRTPDGEYGWIEHSARRWRDPAARRVDLRSFLDQQGFGFE